jgi:hypothetical protein
MATKNLFALKQPFSDSGNAFKVENVDGTTTVYVDDVAITSYVADVTASAAELNILDGATATTAEINMLDDSAASVTIAYAASATTDGIEVTYTVKDAAGVAIDAIHCLECWVSDDADGSGLTATSASGNLTAVTGTILTAFTAKKHFSGNTDANGVLVVELVDAANTTGERFCVKNPFNGKIIVGAATVGTDYEGGV